MATTFRKTMQTVKNFLGVTDKYLDDAIAGIGILDVTGQYFQDHQRDGIHQRLDRYKKHWSYYNGSFFKNPRADGAKKLVVNMCRPIVDKSCDWLVQNGFRFETPPGNEKIAELLDVVWADNDKDLLAWMTAQMGGVTGDAFLYASVEDKDEDGNPIPEDDRRTVIRLLPSSYCHPVYTSIDPENMKGILVQFPTTAPSEGMTGEYETSRPLIVFSLWITRKEIKTYHNRVLISTTPNPIGEIPIVHCKNLPLSTSFFGQSDIDQVGDLNDDLNVIGGAINEILLYSAMPTTLIFGARASLLEKSPDKVWSNLPENAKVENLEMKSELTSSREHYNTIRRAIFELSNTPEGALGEEQAISNTSGIALEVRYMPLMEKTRRKRITYGKAIVKLNKILLLLMEKVLGIDISAVANDKDNLYQTSLKWNSPLPADEKAIIDNLIAKLDAGLESKAGALRVLGERDLAMKTVEILADERMKMAIEVERAQASTGEKVLNLSVTGLGSLALANDAGEVFDEQDRMLLEAEIGKRKEDAKIVAENTPAPVVAAPKPAAPK